MIRRVIETVEALEVDWIRGARAATEAEKAAGGNVVVDTDVGPLLLRVVESKFGAGSFKVRRAKGFGIVVAREATSAAMLRRRILGALFPLRSRAKGG